MTEANEFRRLHFCHPSTETVIIHCWIPARELRAAGNVPTATVFFKDIQQ